MHRLLNKYKKYILLVGVLFLIGIVVGIIYYNFLDSTIKLRIINTIKNSTPLRYNFIIKHLIIMSLLLVTSFLIIGFFLSLFYLLYEGLIVGFLLNAFFVTYKTKGLIYILSYLIINRLLTFILIILFIIRCFNISRLVVGILIYRNDDSIKKKILNNLKKSIYILLIVLIINIILYFISPYISNILFKL